MSINRIAADIVPMIWYTIYNIFLRDFLQNRRVNSSQEYLGQFIMYVCICIWYADIVIEYSIIFLTTLLIRQAAYHPFPNLGYIQNYYFILIDLFLPAWCKYLPDLPVNISPNGKINQSKEINPCLVFLHGWELGLNAFLALTYMPVCFYKRFIS